MTKHLIYKTTNLVNGKFYIGVHSCNCKSCSYLGSGVALKAAIKEYGRDSFSRETLKVCSSREGAFEIEKNLVNHRTNKSYNMASGGRGGQAGVSPTQETLNKLSAYQKGRAKSEAHKLAISEAVSGERYHQFGKPRTERVRKAIQKAQGISISIEGVEYTSIREACKTLRMAYKTVVKRLASHDYPTYVRL